MSTKAEENEVLEDEDLTIEETEETIEEVNDEQEPIDSQESQEVTDDSQTESEEIVVSIGEETPPPEEEVRAPEWVRELRKSHRELQRKNRELEQKLQTTTTENKPVVLGKKPTLEDHDYDAEAFETALSNWYERKRQADEAEVQARRAEEEQQKAWQSKLDNYNKAKTELKVKDFDDAEGFAQEVFSVTQQGVMLQGAENPALVIYALGKNPKKAKELASINDPVKFAFAVAKLETQLKVTNRKASTAPEKIVTGTGRVSGTVDSVLERLREEAARTGNMDKVMAYKRKLRANQK